MQAALHDHECAHVIVPVFMPPVTIDARNIEEFARDVAEFLNRHESMVIDCSQVSWITTSAMRFLAATARDAQITLVHPSPAVHLMATTHGVDVRLRTGRRSCPDREAACPAPRLVSLDTNGQAAS